MACSTGSWGPVLGLTHLTVSPNACHVSTGVSTGSCEVIHGHSPYKLDSIAGKSQQHDHTLTRCDKQPLMKQEKLSGEA
jgi:hypothetical protein